MKAITKLRIIAISVIAVIYFCLLVVIPYTTRVTRHPIDYYRFKKDVRMGYVEVVKRDTFWKTEETLILKNTRDESRYNLTHVFKNRREFHKPEVEHYEYLTDTDGDFVCYKDDDADVLKLLNTKEVKR